MTSGHLGRRTATALTTLTALLATGLAAAPAYAADLVVTTTDDSGAGSLREALAQASASAADDRITFAPSVRGTITLTSGQLLATVGGGSGELTIEGPGADALALDGQDLSRVLDVQGAASTPAFELSGITLTRGEPTDYGQAGGALRVLDASATLSGVVIEASQDSGDGFEPASGGGVSVTASEGAAASLDLVDSTVSGNEASDHGGGVHAGPGVTLTVTRSSVEGNTAGSEAGYLDAPFEYGTGGGISAPRATVVDSTIAGNDAFETCGGLDVRDLVLRGSTVSGNSARDFGGGLCVGGADAAGVLLADSATVTRNFSREGGAINSRNADDSIELTLSTVVDNAAMSGGGVFTSGSVQLRGSVVAMNPGGDLAGGGTAVSNRSLVQDARDVAVTEAGGSLPGQDPVIQSLTEAGGATATMPPAANSPLVDAGAAYGASTDQRGSVRPVDDPGATNAVDGSDVGSVELGLSELAGPDQLVSLERPRIKGIARVGEVLRTHGGEWSSDDVTLSYQWLRNGVPIDGANGRKYRVSSSDRGNAGITRPGFDRRKVLAVRVTAQAPGTRPAIAESDTTRFVGRGQYFTMDGRPKVTGSTEVGSVLRAKPRVSAVSPRPEQVTIEWIVGTRAYPRKENDRRFTLRRGMRGKDVRVVFRYRSGPDELERVVDKPRPVR